MSVGGFCNAYGAEREVTRAWAGIWDQPVAMRAECHAPAAHRFRWVCHHPDGSPREWGPGGHKGKIISLCEQHYGEFTGARTARYEGMEHQFRELNGRVLPVPWNLRRDVQTCGACAAEAPDCDNPEHQVMMRGKPGRCGCRQHKCNVRLELVS